MFILSTAAFVIWGLNPAPPMDEALVAMVSSDTVTVQTEPWLVFQPAQGSPTTGLIFYPGGHVDPRAYAPAAYKIAENGYLVVIVPMPLNLAVFGAGKAKDVMLAFPSIQKWVIAGHSLGGSMAGSFRIVIPIVSMGFSFWLPSLLKVTIFPMMILNLNPYMGLWMGFPPSLKFKLLSLSSRETRAEVPYGTWSSKIGFTGCGKKWKAHFVHGFTSRGITSSRAGNAIQRHTAELNSMKSLLPVVCGDTIYHGCGHYHRQLIYKPEFGMDLYLVDDGQQMHQIYTAVMDNEYIPPDLRWYGCSGAFMKQYIKGKTTYSEKAGYKPVEIGMLKLVVKNYLLHSVEKIPL